MGSAIEDAWDSMFGGDSIWGQAWDAVGGTALWEGSGMNVGDWGPGIPDQNGGYDLSSSGSKSACAKAPDETNVPAVAQSVSGDAAKAVEAQGTARKRARGIMQTYTRYDTGGNVGKTKLGE